MAKRRKFADVVGYDYESREEYEKHIEIMAKNGWTLCDKSGWNLDTKELDDERWKICAYYYKDLM